ncbi:hypothetical protein [Labrys neptuniae]
MNEIVTTKQVTGSELELPTGYNENTSLAVSLARAEVDQQIATSRALPRNLTRVVGNILTLATLDDQSAEECVYALPRGGKPIKGPSIRLAEIIGSQWGNCRIGARVVHVDRFEKFVEAEGVFHDLETNTATTARVRRRISDKHGKLLTDDMIVVTGNAACSIAKRNAILGGVPKAVWRKAYDAVEQVIAGDIKTLAERKELAFKAFAAFGVKPEQLFDALGIGGTEDISLDHLSTLTGMRAALKNGESTVEEMFPKQAAPQAGGAKGLTAALDKLGEGGSQKAAETKPRAEKQEKPKDPPHDPETGEIKDRATTEANSATEKATATTDTAEKATDKAAAETKVEPASTDQDNDDLTDDDSLLGKARAKAMEGSKPFRFWKGKLTEAEMAELEPHLKALDQAAKQADGGAA